MPRSPYPIITCFSSPRPHSLDWSILDFPRIISLSPNRTENDDERGSTPISKESKTTIEYSPPKVSVPTIQFSNKKVKSILSFSLNSFELIFYIRYTPPFLHRPYYIPYHIFLESPGHVSIKHPREWALTLFIFPIKVKIYARVKHYFTVSSPEWVNGGEGRHVHPMFCPGKIGRLPGRLFYFPSVYYADRRRTHPEFPGVIRHSTLDVPHACHPWMLTIYNTRSREGKGSSSGFLHVGSL